MHNWGIPFGFRYKESDQVRLGYPLRDVCWHFTIADLAMAGVSELELYDQTYAGGWYIDAPKRWEAGLVV